MDQEKLILILISVCILLTLVFGIISVLNNNNSGAAIDFNVLRAEHLTLAQNQGFIFDSIVNSNLCGVHDFIPDSNRLNEVPRGVVYSCFVAVNES